MMKAWRTDLQALTHEEQLAHSDIVVARITSSRLLQCRSSFAQGKYYHSLFSCHSHFRVFYCFVQSEWKVQATDYVCACILKSSFFASSFVFIYLVVRRDVDDATNAQTCTYIFCLGFLHAAKLTLLHLHNIRPPQTWNRGVCVTLEVMRMFTLATCFSQLSCKLGGNSTWIFCRIVRIAPSVLAGQAKAGEFWFSASQQSQPVKLNLNFSLKGRLPCSVCDKFRLRLSQHFRVEGNLPKLWLWKNQSCEMSKLRTFSLMKLERQALEKEDNAFD